ncbi:MAG TPA: hypothetical protein QGH10_07355, partial [Armatimonadota bacterium]|nr:hypothetical protein [Armatimonadota bacterium]
MLMLLAALNSPIAAQPAPNPTVVRALADRILACHHEPTGVLFTDTLDKRAGGLIPYFAHFHAYGLLRAYEAIDDERCLSAADTWIDWYRGHMQADGTVTDYTFNADDTLTTTGDMDSTDSYAAMYLWLVSERYRVTGAPTEWLRERERSCFLALSGILLTMQPDGLTIAKPSYAIEYTMDNAEVIVGFRSAALIFDALENPGMASHARRLADRTEEELRTLYDEDRGYFAWYRDMNGDMGFALEKWYPDVMAQVLPLMRIGRPEGPDQSVLAKIVADNPLPEFDATAAQRQIWYGLAAQR